MKVTMPSQKKTIDRDELVAAARRARLNAYVPYSHYQVGAALLTNRGTIFTGCNVENAAYPACICAERVAVTKAVSEGERDFVAIAVVTSNGGTPCGVCRQVLNEFSPDMLVIVSDPEQIVSEYVLADLLPDGFGPHHLK
jgi:cytidine deaminase